MRARAALLCLCALGAYILWTSSTDQLVQSLPSESRPWLDTSPDPLTPLTPTLPTHPDQPATAPEAPVEPTQPASAVDVVPSHRPPQPSSPRPRKTHNASACIGPTVPPALPPKEAEALKAEIWRTTKAWGYHELAQNYRPFKGMDVLDIGMGQGPMGVVAISVGVKSYKGMDPALCINQRARTRDKTVGRAPNEGECLLIRDSAECKKEGETCEKFRSCMDLWRKKYHTFPYTGLEIMQAYAGRIVLLPGTFASLQPSGLIKHGSFQVATMWLVTEHLPNNRDVIEGIFEWTTPGQLLVLKHHNYYGFDGHHQKPRYPEKYDPTNPSETSVAFWRHLNPTSWVFNSTNTNRVRLGDLIALIDVYFDCAWRATFESKWSPALDAKLWEKLKNRGFARNELLINKWSAACARREAPLPATWLESRVWLLPATDGSYEPMPLPDQLMSKHRGNTVTRIPAKQKHLEQYLAP
ncbi:unnamed protein product [Durusdinium trenchii]|uniref:Methyltransferase n=2 Tax=Durusdinium trenchii TaxID=1381693 RepID=A0ABP0PL21_9DINO